MIPQDVLQEAWISLIRVELEDRLMTLTWEMGKMISKLFISRLIFDAEIKKAREKFKELFGFV